MVEVGQTLNDFDLTPPPKVLIALTHTPMQPLDALCELIDNAIDSFQAAKLTGVPVEHPLVTINLPKPSEILSGLGVVRVRDNGPGMAHDDAEKALRAGFSGNNPYDSLGLFGMGFNISTGKLGRVTRFLTAQHDKPQAVEVIVNIEEMSRSGSYRVPPKAIEKPEHFEHGTIVEVSGWWPDGNANSGFVRKLVQYGMPRVREEIGRRYATILRDQNIRIIVNDEPCKPFEHCIWSDARSIQRQRYGTIPAVYRFNELIGSQKRCSTCMAVVPPEESSCVVCGGSGIRTIEERIRGWVGIQRFDNENDYGIDLIRNGRAIRIGEKTAFFEFVDEFKKTIKDYPVDQIYGRIVGEIHLDHVPVDFLKQDFQRSSSEWQNAILFLRGNTSLQPGQIKTGDENESPVFMLYQGYRRVRTPGKTDMYMGYWDVEDGKPKRISRDVEKEYYAKFLEKVPGYYDDTEWWKLVEAADQKPLDELVPCPVCDTENIKGHETCVTCSHILIGKNCINSKCGVLIPQSAISCPQCGQSQVPEIEEPWNCQICGRRNPSNNEICGDCGSTKGSLNPVSRDYLVMHSNKADEMSINGCAVQLANGSDSATLFL